MTAPVWMALPPEVHSTLLSRGQGRAACWPRRRVEFVEHRLCVIRPTSSAQSWRGCRAGRGRGPAPSDTWPRMCPIWRGWCGPAQQRGAAAQHETAATAYTAALAAMPTLPELAANHAVHGVLTATNFFGINTIPIALNEADYARMWVQAATTMSTYQAVAPRRWRGTADRRGATNHGCDDATAVTAGCSTSSTTTPATPTT